MDRFEFERAAKLELDAAKIGGNTVQLLMVLYSKCEELEERVRKLERSDGSGVPMDRYGDR